MHYARVLAFLMVALAWTNNVHAGFFDDLFGGRDAKRDAPAASMALDVIGAADSVEVDIPLKQVGSDYRLGPGDKISITVFNEKDLSLDVRLSDAGSFLYPFIGEVPARGMTISALQMFLSNNLAEGYLVDPKVYVSVMEYRPFFVNGEVTKPGGYAFQPGLTVRKAISLAGGLTARASLSKIYVIHEDDPAGLPRLTSLNSSIRPGDIVTVDQSFF